MLKNNPKLKMFEENIKKQKLEEERMRKEQEKREKNREDMRRKKNGFASFLFFDNEIDEDLLHDWI